MLDYARLPEGEPADRVAVMVTFLQMPLNPLPQQAQPVMRLPSGFLLKRQRLSPAGYLTLYTEIGAPWLWWLRRVMPLDLLAEHLASPAVTTHVLKNDGGTCGFFELDTGGWPDVNLNYFGLAQEVMGLGLGKQLLRRAIYEAALMRRAGTAWPGAPRRLTVNTCTADHPRALPNYLQAGFTPLRTLREVWDIPRRLGLRIPDRLRA